MPYYWTVFFCVEYVNSEWNPTFKVSFYRYEFSAYVINSGVKNYHLLWWSHLHSGVLSWIFSEWIKICSRKVTSCNSKSVSIFERKIWKKLTGSNRLELWSLKMLLQGCLKAPWESGKYFLGLFICCLFQIHANFTQKRVQRL